LDRKLAARVLQVMPKDAAVQIMNEPHLEQPAELIGLMPVDSAASILIDLNPDRRADVFGELPEGLRAALSPRLDASARAVLERLLSYPAHSAGGLMTTDFVSVPIDWTVAQTLRHIHDIGRSTETVYTVCLIDPRSQRLVKVIALGRLVVSDADANVLAAARPYAPITVTPLT